MKKIKFGIVGIGNMGKMRLELLKNRITSAEVIAICGRNPEKNRRIQEEYEIAYSYTDINEMLENKKIDAIVVSTGADAHKEPVIAACRAGKHVFCEKPLAKTIEDCEEIEKAAYENADKCFTVAFMRRFDPSYAKAKEKIKKGKIGTPIMYKGTSLDPDSVLPNHLDGVKKGIYVPWFIEMGSHDTDLARWFLDGEPEVSHAFGGAYVCSELEEYEDYDNGFSLTRFDNGRTAYIQVGRTATCSHVESEIIGTKGTIRINSIPRKNYLSSFTKEGYVEECQESFMNRWSEAFYNETADFVDCIINNKKPEVTAKDGTASLDFCLRIHNAYLEEK